MKHTQERHAIVFQNRIYAVEPDFALVREIEWELEGIPALFEKFSSGRWKVHELVTLVQMMLQAAGETVDYLALGNVILKDGVNRYLAAACAFLARVLCVNAEGERHEN